MNSLINYRLTGVRGAAFPNMHIQLPTRVLYINGFKGVRKVIDKNVNPADYGDMAPLVKFGCAITPGVVMTPISSILEACNANLNPEPLHVRWLRGFTLRLVREVIFGVGLNQMSDHFEQVIPTDYSPAIRNAGGSMIAGVVSGYLSHVPHNLSTMKLMTPSKSYALLLHEFSQQRMGSVKFLPTAMQSPAATCLSIVAPKGLLVRTTQVVGSFVLLNGIIHLMGGVHWNRNEEDD